MKGTAIAGIVLIVLGLGGFALGGFSFTTKEKVLDLGPIEATADKKHDVAIPQIAAVIAFAAGIALVIAGTRKA
ncbi:MAG: hypothetical protein K2P94_06400 [Rhodospirillaceae bacterium]|nr:hypothetical protein [Rhodospirillaceae bacterium]